MIKKSRYILISILILTIFGSFLAFPVLASSTFTGDGTADIEQPTGELPASALPHAPGYQPLPNRPLTISPANSLGVQFLLVATTANATGNTLIIDHPLTNGDPNAVIIVTPNWNPGGIGGTYNNHPIGVYYDGSKWRIFNQDLATIPVGAAFNVIIPAAGPGVFALTENFPGPTAFDLKIDNPLTNNNPNARILVTANANPGGGTLNYFSDPAGVYYSNLDHKWRIYYLDNSSMLLVVSFNVFILPASAGAFTQTSTTGNINGDGTQIDNSLTNNNPNALVFVTPNRNPGDVWGTVSNHSYGVWTDGNHWLIFNQDVATMPANVSFNVLVLVPTSDVFVHTASVSNTSDYLTLIDNALTNSHPNAIAFINPDYTPAGIIGINDNANIGVGYPVVGNQWAIFNQDSSVMPVGASFNVLIPNPDASVFTHKATAANIAGHITTLDYPLTNNNPNATVFVTLNSDPGGIGGIYDNHPVGVYYVTGKWRIFNEDTQPMPLNASFNVFAPTSGSNVFVHTATAGNTSGIGTSIDNPLTNGNQNALLLITQNWDPGGVGGIYNAHPVGVLFQANKWFIVNVDSASMPIGASFNVYVFPDFKIDLPLISR